LRLRLNMKHEAEQFEFSFANATKSGIIFTVIYKNNERTRAEVIKILESAIKDGQDLSQVQIQCPIFRTFSLWPGLQSLASLPLNYQCEELELKDGKFLTLRKLVLDAEAKVA
jgi:hypothetical protein